MLQPQTILQFLQNVDMANFLLFIFRPTINIHFFIYQ